MIKSIPLVATMVALGACATPPDAEGQDAVASCVSPGAFNDGKPECREYLGEAWSLDSSAEDCASRQGVFTAARPCDRQGGLGGCVFADKSRPVRIVPIEDPATCVSQQRGCEVFGGGAWTPFEACGGADPDNFSGTGLAVFVQPTLVCRAPLPGQPPGQADGGQVCTWQGTQGCTEPGRNFGDYASCEVVRTQRPAAPLAVNTRVSPPERLNEPVRKAEAAWVKAQIDSCSCVCCHSAQSPVGPMLWSTDGDAWIDTWYDSAVAAGAGLIDSTGFGVYPADQNNGFRRAGVPGTIDRSIFASTDPERLARFFEEELAWRGRSPSEFVNSPPFGNAIYQQQFFAPQPCVRGEGVGADGTVTWRGGRARYVYVLEGNSLSPTIPPNLDLPLGTIWRLDVAAESAPLASGALRLGEVPPGTAQRVPVTGPPALQAGRSYYLYVAADVALPVTRCVFVAP
jgi:hypothetical protein